MCEPTAILAGTMAVTSAASSAMGINAKNEQAEAMAENANEAYLADQDAFRVREDQIEDQAAQKMTERQLQTQREQAKLRVSFAEGNVLGNTPMRQLHTSLLQSGMDVGQIKENRDDSLAQNRRDLDASYSRLESRRNSAEAQMTGPLGAALQIGTSAAGGAMQGYQMGKLWGSGPSSSSGAGSGPSGQIGQQGGSYSQYGR